MGVAGGPNIEREGLVFGYDTGLNPSSNFDHTSSPRRYFKGRPTQNYIPNPYFVDGNGQPTVSGYSTFGFSHNNTLSATSTPSAVGNGYSAKIVKNTTTKGTIVETVTIPALSNGDTVVVSWYARGYNGSEDQTCQTHCYINSSEGAISTGTYSTVTSEWKRFYHVLTWNKQVSSYTSANSYFYSGFGTGTEFLVSNPQVELYKASPTPFTATSRSVSGSLIDLTKSTTIDVSNVSFDSNGQPTFDGTDDYIDLPNPGVASSPTFTTEFIIKVNDYSTQPIFISPNSVGIDHFFRMNAIGKLYARFVEVADSSADDYVSTTTISTTNYYHIVMSKSPSNGTLYVNGVSEDSHTPTLTSAAWSGNWRIGRRSNGTYHFNGELPVLKVYDRALTAQEVQQNFKAYKNRFNI